MTYQEFYDEVTPAILELQEECRKMTEEEFNAYCRSVSDTIHQSKPNISERFMAEVFKVIHRRIFEGSTVP